MKIFKHVLTYLFGVFMILGSYSHFTNPGMYAGFFPEFFPRDLINTLGGIVELVLGIALFVPSTRSMATLGILVLMLTFLPLHIIDVFKSHPAVGTHQNALIRLPIQFVFILWAWFIYKK
jgi:uncharacterized membrane protein